MTRRCVCATVAIVAVGCYRLGVQIARRRDRRAITNLLVELGRQRVAPPKDDWQDELLRRCATSPSYALKRPPFERPYRSRKTR